MKTALCLILAVAALSGAEKNPLPKDLPAYGALKPVTPPAVKESKLPNGVTLWLVPIPGFPKAALVAAARGGFAADPADRPGLAELMAKTITQGTATRTARQIAEEFQAAGGDVSASATADAIIVQTNVLAESAAAAVRLLADIVQNPAFSSREVEIAKRNAASELDASEAEPAFLARRAFNRSLFGTHPYSVIGPTRESIASTTELALRSQYARVFRPENVLLVVAGDFGATEMGALVSSAFGSWKSSAEAPPDLPKPEAGASRAVVYVPRPNSVQTALYIGALGPSPREPDFEAAQVADAMYGGMFGSRLIANIREDKGYTYSPYSFLSRMRQTGVLVTGADVRNEVTGASFNEISYELNRMATTAPEESDLERAKRYLVGIAALRLQSRSAIAQQLATLWIFGMPPEELGRRTERIGQVNVKDVESAGRKYFPMHRMTVVAVGEENVIKTELSPFGLEFKRSE